MGAVRIRAKNTGVKYTFCDYPMPDSSLSLITLWFRSAHPHAYHRSRMTAGVNYVSKEFFTVVSKRKNANRKPSPLVGEGGGGSRRKGQV